MISDWEQQGRLPAAAPQLTVDKQTGAIGLTVADTTVRVNPDFIQSYQCRVLVDSIRGWLGAIDPALFSNHRDGREALYALMATCSDLLSASMPIDSEMGFTPGLVIAAWPDTFHLSLDDVKKLCDITQVPFVVITAADQADNFLTYHYQPNCELSPKARINQIALPDVTLQSVMLNCGASPEKTAIATVNHAWANAARGLNMKEIGPSWLHGCINDQAQLQKTLTDILAKHPLTL